ncbi:MAG: RNA polymerase subunit sigma-70, partial [Proteobacteria bacterium]|nr:RNA polymerase subunit sigma-70 [Burkholderiales bacterium]
VAALETWPRTGVPASPEAWLTTAAKRNLLHAARHTRVIEDPAVTTLLELEASVEASVVLPDSRLNLMFVCAHPAIDETVRTPLMLQTVLGVDVGRIASAFLVSPSAMAQRLVRAKQKIRDARIAFDPPEARELAGRMDAVLEGIYAAFGADWESAGVDATGSGIASNIALDGLAQEAIFLARVVSSLLPDEPEPIGLLALLLSSHARRAARFTDSAAGVATFVPLTEQDTARWNRSAIVEADRLLARAAALRRPGPFQLEAAIQSAHCQRLFTGATPWTGIVELYRALNRLAPIRASEIGLAVALVEIGDLTEARRVLDALPAASVRAHQPYWIARWHLARRCGDATAARAALVNGIGLTVDPRVRVYLASQLQPA